MAKIKTASTKGFKVLEHKADEYLMAYGSTLEEAFEEAALAMFEIMTDTTKIEPRLMETMTIEAEDEIALLYTWLESLLVKFDAEGKLYSKFQIAKLQKSGKNILLKGKIWGENYNPNKHQSRTDVKAITYHQMEILKNEGKFIVKFILDV